MKKLIFSSLIAMTILYFWPKKAIAQSDSSIYNFVSMENPPKYPGGMAGFYKFLGSNIKYPETAIKNKTQGSVLVSFVVEKDGTLSDIQVNRKLGSGTDEEAVRVLKLAQKWQPGIQDGKIVRVKYNLPIKFSLPANNAQINLNENKASQNIDNEAVFSFFTMENPPKYPGGMQQFYKTISSNIKYPEAAIKNKVQGTVFISFIVEKDGSLSDIKIDRKLGSGTDEEAVRVIGLTSKWNPGIDKGKPVRVKYNIPVKFSLS